MSDLSGSPEMSPASFLRPGAAVALAERRAPAGPELPGLGQPDAGPGPLSVATASVVVTLSAGVLLAVLGLIVCSIYAAAFTSAMSGIPTTSRSSAGSGSSYSGTTAGQYPSGTYEVGGFAGQIPAGRYAAASGSSHCYYARLSSVDGDIRSIIANDDELNGGPMIVDIKSSDAAFQISGDCTFTKQ